ncbi:proline racemase family protein [Blastopirellula marina]|uniref:Hydroxyproline-2-epimerase n=1 Tax=Blastopirellula marina TaxID=124 RepID=A0A2S8GCV0_9BACT|nr:proline racemase family protein [Blastopirellula marina]PQO42259.1 hydroxyproline-2-epimerase [Blastopirellula marina]
MALPTDRIELSVIDSHTGGEPTRTIIGGGPDLKGESVAEQIADFRAHYDWVRTALTHEPRGYEAMVGALLLHPDNSDAVARVVFFNNVGYIGMCGHGTIGVAATLAYLGKISPGEHLLETISGDVLFTLHEDNRVSLVNVPSYRYRQSVPVQTQSFGEVTGDIAYGGNWFYLCSDHGQEISMDNLAQLQQCSREIREAIDAAGIGGADGGIIDHIELMGPPRREDADAANYVYCPGGQYDRSPCGTGTSAKLACLAADGKLAEGDTWRQESVTGSLFEGSYQQQGDKILPRIMGEAFITAETKVVIDPIDPLTFGFRHNLGED